MLLVFLLTTGDTLVLDTNIIIVVLMNILPVQICGNIVNQPIRGHKRLISRIHDTTLFALQLGAKVMWDSVCNLCPTIFQIHTKMTFGNTILQPIIGHRKPIFPALREFMP